MEHHLHDEDGNSGITNFWWDRLSSTLYSRVERPAKSATVFNLGYTEQVAARYPRVARRSGGGAVLSPAPARQIGDRALRPS